MRDSLITRESDLYSLVVKMEIQVIYVMRFERRERSSWAEIGNSWIRFRGGGVATALKGRQESGEKGDRSPACRAEEGG